MQVPYALCNIVRKKETRNMKLLTTGQWINDRVIEVILNNTT